MSNVIKKQGWSLVSFLLMIYTPIIGAAIFLSIAGIYFKKGGKSEVRDFVISTLRFSLVPIIIGLVVLIFCL